MAAAFVAHGGLAREFLALRDEGAFLLHRAEGGGDGDVGHRLLLQAGQDRRRRRRSLETARTARVVARTTLSRLLSGAQGVEQGGGEQAVARPGALLDGPFWAAASHAQPSATITDTARANLDNADPT